MPRTSRREERSYIRIFFGANVRANGVRQHYLRFGGTGPAIVIVPGISTTAAQWAFVAERLCTGRDIYVLDVRGRGLSESGPHLNYSLDACASDLISFAEALGIGRYTILGHSMGARIGIRAARWRPASVEQLILGGSAGVRSWTACLSDPDRTSPQTAS